MKLLLLLAAMAGSTALVRDTVSQGQDFEVFYRAGFNIIHSERLYSIARDGAMVFKYPPFIAVFFVPLAFFSLAVAKMIWGVTQVVSLFYVVRWLKKNGVSIRSILICTAAFWGIWAVHALDGQVTLVWMAALVLIWRFRPFVIVLSTLKVFTVALLPALDLRPSRKLFGRTLFILLVLTYPAYLAQGSESLIDLAKDWYLSATSGDQAFGIEKTLGRDNQGLPAMVMRLVLMLGLEMSLLGTLSNLIALGLMFFLGYLWHRRSRDFPPTPQGEAFRLMGYFALIPVVLPLSWFHGFVLAFPFAALVGGWAMERDSSKWTKICAVLGLIFITVVTRKTLGPLGAIAENFSIKALGVLLLFKGAFLFLESQRAQTGDAESPQVF